MSTHKIALLLNHSRVENGYAHLSVRLITWDDKEAEYHASFNGDLKPSYYFGASDGVEIGMTAQLGSGGTREDEFRKPYAIRLGVKGRSDDYMSAELAANVAKASKKLHARMAAIQSEFGYSEDFDELVVRLGSALKCGFVVRSETADYFRHMNATEARYWVNNAIQTLNVRLFPAIA